MKLEKITATEATLTLTAEELRLLNNAMNESLEALGEDEDEFQNRMGSSSQKVEELLTAVNALVQQMS
jgi:hypothetical protein